MFIGSYWFYNQTARGRRAIAEQQAMLQNGIERVITIYTDDGTILKKYKGKIDIEYEDNCVKFDWDGKRYIYYNCCVETIAEIP